MPEVKFSVNRSGKRTLIRMPDEPALRAEFQKAHRDLMPLLSEARQSEPSFDDLKRSPEFMAFIESQANAGQTFTFALGIAGEEGRVVRKEVLLLDGAGKVCAISRWERGEGARFVVAN